MKTLRWLEWIAFAASSAVIHYAVAAFVYVLGPGLDNCENVREAPVANERGVLAEAMARYCDFIGFPNEKRFGLHLSDDSGDSVLVFYEPRNNRDAPILRGLDADHLNVDLGEPEFRREVRHLSALSLLDFPFLGAAFASSKCSGRRRRGRGKSDLSLVSPSAPSVALRVRIHRGDLAYPANRPSWPRYHQLHLQRRRAEPRIEHARSQLLFTCLACLWAPTPAPHDRARRAGPHFVFFRREDPRRLTLSRLFGMAKIEPCKWAGRCRRDHGPWQRTWARQPAISGPRAPSGECLRQARRSLQANGPARSALARRRSLAG
jgi:hypothetical protein